MTILMCIVVSAIISIAIVKLFAYRYFDVIDHHMQELLEDTRKSIDSAVNSLSDTARNK